jgi:hypothetical protein
MALGAAAVVAAAWLAGQMIDGHVHKVQNGGVLVHCGGGVVEVIVRRRGEVVDGGHVADVEAWLWNEKDRWVPPTGRSVRVSEGPRGKAVLLQTVRDHFEGKLPTSAEDGPLPLEVVVVVGGGKTSRARVTWTNLDDRERMNDGRMPLMRQRGKQRPPPPAPPERRPSPPR